MFHTGISYRSYDTPIQEHYATMKNDAVRKTECVNTRGGGGRDLCMHKRFLKGGQRNR